MQTKKAMNP